MVIGGVVQKDASASNAGDAVDVHVRETTSAPLRILTIEWNPLALVTITKLSANVIVLPTSHHALVLSPFYATTATAPVGIFDDTSIASGNPVSLLPKERFTGVGGELGYRYYVGENGPRGLFFGPSLILASFTERAAGQTDISFLDYGLAGDLGYEMLVADRVALTLGGGVQGLLTSKSIPDQSQWPAKIYANGAVRPRLLFSIGWAF